MIQVRSHKRHVYKKWVIWRIWIASILVFNEAYSFLTNVSFQWSGVGFWQLWAGQWRWDWAGPWYNWLVGGSDTIFQIKCYTEITVRLGLTYIWYDWLDPSQENSRKRRSYFCDKIKTRNPTENNRSNVTILSGNCWEIANNFNKQTKNIIFWIHHLVTITLHANEILLANSVLFLDGFYVFNKYFLWNSSIEIWAKVRLKKITPWPFS